METPYPARRASSGFFFFFRGKLREKLSVSRIPFKQETYFIQPGLSRSSECQGQAYVMPSITTSIWQTAADIAKQTKICCHTTILNASMCTTFRHGLFMTLNFQTTSGVICGQSRGLYKVWYGYYLGKR